MTRSLLVGEKSPKKCRICGDPWPCRADHTGATDSWTGEPLHESLPIGEKEIASLLTEHGYPVEIDTVHKWSARDRLPRPDGTLSGRSWWWTSTILRWAVETGRLDQYPIGHEEPRR